MYEFLNDIPKAPREMAPNLPWLVGKKKLGFLFKKSWAKTLTEGKVVFCATIQSAEMEDVGNGEVGHGGMGVYLYTTDEKYIKDDKFLKEIADKMREIRFKEGDLTASEKKIADALNDTGTAIRDFTIPTDLTNGVTCYIDTDYLNSLYFDTDYVPQIFPALLTNNADGKYNVQNINVKKYKELSGK